MFCYISNGNNIGIYCDKYIPNNSATVPLNKWTHVVWMRSNSKIYSFVNGNANLIDNNPLWANTLYPLNSIIVGGEIYYNLINNNMSACKFIGNISQPLITTTAKYNINGFIPQWNLKPLNMDNVLFLLQDNFINNSIGKSMVNNNNVIIPSYSLPSINLNVITGGILYLIILIILLV